MDLQRQVYVFAVTLAAGMILGILYDIYRVLRQKFRPQRIMTGLSDLLYWLSATLVVFLALVASNWGELRFYVYLGLVGGVGVYYRFCSRFVLFGVMGFVRFITAGMRVVRCFARLILIRPVVFGARIITWPCRFAGKKAIKKYLNWKASREKK
jgi:spore cortex biosynthesis protein YabQ